jgi:hypothetical protein
VIALQPDNFPRGALRGHAKRVAFPLDDQYRQLDRLELWEATLGRIVGLSRRMKREGQAEDGKRSGVGRGAAGHPSSRRTPAHDQRKVTQLVVHKPGDDRYPGAVQLGSGSRRPAAGDSIRLFDKHHAEVDFARRPRRCEQVGCVDAASRPVAED